MPKKKGGKKGGKKGKGKKKAEKGMTPEVFQDLLKVQIKESALADAQAKGLSQLLEREMEAREKESDPVNFMLGSHLAEGVPLTPETVDVLCTTLGKFDAELQRVRFCSVLGFLGTRLGDSLATSVSTVINTLPSLSRVEMTRASLTPRGCFKLGHAISRNSRLLKNLKRLNLSFNKFGTDGLANLCEGIQQGSVLESLNLSYCDLDERGGKFLMKLLQGSAKLKSLNVTGNNLRSLGLQCSLQAIQNSPSHLETLTFSMNQVGAEENSEIVEATFHDLCVVLSNDQLALKTLDLLGNPVPEAFAPELVAAYKRGKVRKLVTPHGWQWKDKEVRDLFQKTAAKRASGGGKKKKGGKKKGKKKK